ncbi:imm11 family protein [Pseudomonas savastanoi]|uniref:Immunity MXAN-0049 protein domain-containing protein n=4 Tax=Pseudomonas savastanoi TaxID=29438 RepID=A0A3M3UMB3_PSESG|nr:DUF1629 domain-containing protein [Pseudomonas savastanoi]RMM92136.1 hypothetical protein ALQ70_101734 [Pseudomonas savastanoi pv. glycinea]RMO34406.1 hypothetical protein ALQ42_101604 [Pseudomonas savastanoi pv. glycinea]
MAKIFIINISSSYPESYWFKSNVLTGQDPILLKKGMEISEDVLVEFTSTSRASTNGILKYDFFFSDGPNFISPRFHKLLLEANVSGVQFFDANVYISGKKYEGYKFFIPTSRLSAFDKEKSKNEPLVSYLPDGPKIYTEIVLKDDVDIGVDIFRAEEDFTTILATARVKDLCEINKVRGLQFKEHILKA